MKALKTLFALIMAIFAAALVAGVAWSVCSFTLHRGHVVGESFSNCDHRTQLGCGEVYRIETDGGDQVEIPAVQEFRDEDGVFLSGDDSYVVVTEYGLFGVFLTLAALGSAVVLFRSVTGESRHGDDVDDQDHGGDDREHESDHRE